MFFADRRVAEVKYTKALQIRQRGQVADLRAPEVKPLKVLQICEWGQVADRRVVQTE